MLESEDRKPPRGLLEFGRELLIVVAGVVIAIGLGQTVDAAHWHDNVSEARDSLRHELHDNGEFYEFRIVANDCVARRLAELDRIAEDLAAHRKVGPVGDLTPHLGHLLADDVWQSERSAQTLTHFPRKELEQFSATYSQQIDMRGWLNREIEFWAGIRLLQGDPTRLTASDLTLIRNGIQSARALNYLVVVNARKQLKTNAGLGVPKAKADPADLAGVCAPLSRAAPRLPYTTY
jgi:hypothetical protein